MRARLLVLLVVAVPAFAGGLDYDAFSDAEGHVGTPEQILAAQEMVRAPGQFETVFAEAAKGNRRAARVFQELETRFFPDIGRAVAEREAQLKCRMPVIKELATGDCRPDWTGLDFLPKTEAGVRLRKAAIDAYQARAKQLGIEAAVIIATVNATLAVGGAAMVVRSAETRAAAAEATRIAQAVTVPAEQGQVIALGLDRYLKGFADKVGGRTWTQWATGDPLRWRAVFLELAGNPSNRIRFNLTGVDDPWRAVTRAASGTGGATDWELLMIKQHPEWWNRTTFFRDGQAVANPFQ
jgi:hypothetical protein